MQDCMHCKKGRMQITFYVSVKRRLIYIKTNKNFSSGEKELTIMGNGQIDFSQCLRRVSRTIVTHV